MSIKYCVKGIKTLVGAEGRGFNATLYREGKRVATLLDDASGGPLTIQFANPAEADILDEQIKKLPDHTCNFIDTETGKLAVVKYSRDLFLSKLVNLSHVVNVLIRGMKKKIAFKENNELYFIDVDPTDKNKDEASRNHPEAIILNGMSKEAITNLISDFT